MAKKYPARHLVWLAFRYAEEELLGQMSCLEIESPEWTEKNELLEQLQSYRLKRFGDPVTKLCTKEAR